jgi:hypothetical protein
MLVPMPVVTKTPLTLAFPIPNITDVLVTFNRLIWYRSRTGEQGLYEPATAPAAEGAVLTGMMQEPHSLNGKTLSMKINGTTTVDVAFSGPDPYTTAAAIVDIENATALLTAGSDSDGNLVLTTVLTGSAASIEILESDGAAYLGFVAGSASVGLDAHTSLIAGTYQYFYTDSNSDDSFWYRTQFFNSTSLEVSELSVPITGDLAQVVPYANTAVGYVQLADLRGRALVRRKVIVTSLFQPSRVADHVMGRYAVELETDGTGYAEVRLVKGAVIDVAVDGTGRHRRITVPDTDVFDFFDPSLNETDEFGIATLNIPFAIRTS